jgi:two-component system chemotaxis sensor kinase CheA
MDDLLREFLTETNESLDLIDVELVRFEREPNNAAILGHLFRLVHTIKGTCGFLGLSRLEALTHAAETLMGRFRDGAPVSGEAVTLVLLTIDRIKGLLAGLERHQREPDGSDDDLIRSLAAMADFKLALRDAPSFASDVDHCKFTSARAPAEAEENWNDGGVIRDSIRIRVDALEHLMVMVSELVLTRNQLLDIMRRHGDTEFTAPLQRLSSVTAELQDGIMMTRMQPIGHAWRTLPRIVRRRNQARPSGAGADQGSAHAHGS